MVGCCFDDYRETSRSFYLIFFPVPPFCVFVARFFSNLPGLWPYGVFPHYFLTFVRLQSRYCPATYCCFFVLLPLPPALVFFVFPLTFHTFSPIVCSSSFAEVPLARSAPRSAALVPSFKFLRHSHPPQRDFAPPPSCSSADHGNGNKKKHIRPVLTQRSITNPSHVANI